MKDASEQHRLRSKAWRLNNPEKVRAANHAYYLANTEREKQKTKAWFAAHPGRASVYARKRRHGIIEAEYDAAVRRQEGRCAICGTVPAILHVDHDHSTDERRELLCLACNTMLGQAKDSEATLQNAINYLRKHRRA